MAIDTALKRRSAGGVPHHPLGVNVTPDVSKPVAWRATSAWSYAGIAPAPPPVGTALRDKFSLGTKGYFDAGPDAALGGGWGH